MQRFPIAVPLQSRFPQKVSAGCPSFGGQRTVFAPPPPPPVLLRRFALRGKQAALPGRKKPRYRCGMSPQTATRHGPALEAPAETNVGQFVGAAATGVSEFVPRIVSRVQGTVIRTLVASVPYPAQGGLATVRPNPSVKPTHSGLRPPRAAYLKR